MKIAFITDSYTSMSHDIAVHIHILAEGLYRIGHTVLVVIPEVGTREPAIEGRLVKCDGKPAENRAGIQLSKLGKRQLFETLSEFQPDVIHIHTLSETGLYAQQFAQKNRVPALLTVHSLEDAEKGRRRFSPAAMMRERARIRTAQTVLEEAGQIAVLSEAMARRLHEEGLHTSGTLFPSAIDTSLFYPGGAREEQKKALADSLSLGGKTAVLCGVCDDDSIYTVVEEWAEEFRGDDTFQLLIMDREEQTDELLSLIHSLHLSQSVSLTGPLTREETAACYQLSCCYISCSQSEEFHFSAWEAAACGTPLLVRRGSGTACIVESKKNGFVWSEESELFDLVRKFARVQGPGKEALTRLVSSTVRGVTPQNQAVAAERIYLSLLA